MGCATPPNVPKLGVSGIKDTQKLAKIEKSHIAYTVNTKTREHVSQSPLNLKMAPVR